MAGPTAKENTDPGTLARIPEDVITQAYWSLKAAHLKERTQVQTRHKDEGLKLSERHAREESNFWAKHGQPGDQSIVRLPATPTPPVGPSKPSTTTSRAGGFDDGSTYSTALIPREARGKKHKPQRTFHGKEEFAPSPPSVPGKHPNILEVIDLISDSDASDNETTNTGATSKTKTTSWRERARENAPTQLRVPNATNSAKDEPVLNGHGQIAGLTKSKTGKDASPNVRKVTVKTPFILSMSTPLARKWPSPRTPLKPDPKPEISTNAVADQVIDRSSILKNPARLPKDTSLLSLQGLQKKGGFVRSLVDGGNGFSPKLRGVLPSTPRSVEDVMMPDADWGNELSGQARSSMQGSALSALLARRESRQQSLLRDSCARSQSGEYTTPAKDTSNQRRSASISSSVRSAFARPSLPPAQQCARIRELGEILQARFDVSLPLLSAPSEKKSLLVKLKTTKLPSSSSTLAQSPRTPSNPRSGTQSRQPVTPEQSSSPDSVIPPPRPFKIPPRPDSSRFRSAEALGKRRRAREESTISQASTFSNAPPTATDLKRKNVLNLSDSSDDEFIPSPCPAPSNRAANTALKAGSRNNTLPPTKKSRTEPESVQKGVTRAIPSTPTRRLNAPLRSNIAPSTPKGKASGALPSTPPSRTGRETSLCTPRGPAPNRQTAYIPMSEPGSPSVRAAVSKAARARDGTSINSKRPGMTTQPNILSPGRAKRQAGQQAEAKILQNAKAERMFKRKTADEQLAEFAAPDDIDEMEEDMGSASITSTPTLRRSQMDGVSEDSSSYNKASWTRDRMAGERYLCRQQMQVLHEGAENSDEDIDLDPVALFKQFTGENGTITHVEQQAMEQEGEKASEKEMGGENQDPNWIWYDPM
ncbi:hypothetical protein BCR34DRAFT_650109 [Clohesyomyces aquaticus]|uniref:Uncharacterized protein n=1 Tax=Clohesyomyces aquaticus TaxID=1231657 RepID=A0A1Y1ZRW4_9PLEO|nr:hypothetical protein BCR34DRAFT_650109 [Clohesyomyces aquaticus]